MNRATENSCARVGCWREQCSALVTAVGSGLVLPYYGTATFGLNALASGHSAPAAPRPAHRRHPLRHPPPTTGSRWWSSTGISRSVMFAAGLLLPAAGGVLVAVAARRRGGGWSGLPFAPAMVLFLPQVFGPPPVRTARGLLVLVVKFASSSGLGRGSHRRRG